MTTILTVIHILVCLFLVVIVLLQHGKGADIGATFGGASQTLFGTEGPLPLLNKVTTTSAIIFMMTSLALAYLSAHPGKGSVMEAVKPPPPATAPAPEAAPVAPTVPEPVPATEATETFPGAVTAPAEAAGSEQVPAAATTPDTQETSPAAVPQSAPPAEQPTE